MDVNKDVFPETDKSVYVLSEHEMFMREFIALYKQHSVLWSQKHPHYRNRAERTDAYEVLVHKCREYYPDADEDFVRMKIDSMRSTFRKEHRKVLRSKETATVPEDVHKPSLWYYDLLLFIANETDETASNEDETKNQNIEDASLAKISFWNRQYSAIMIDLYKAHPCLYSASHPHGRSKRRRKEAVKKITSGLIEATGKYFQVDDVRKKISMIRGQFLHEYKKVQKSEMSGEPYQPSLWCYEMLSFLRDQYSDKRKWKEETGSSSMDLKRKISRQRSTSEESGDDDMDIKKEFDGPASPDSGSNPIVLNSLPDEPDENDDIFDTIAKNVAHKLRNMTPEQRTIAERIVKDVMYHGQMENLTADSRLSLDGT